LLSFTFRTISRSALISSSFRALSNLRPAYPPSAQIMVLPGLLKGLLPRLRGILSRSCTEAGWTTIPTGQLPANAAICGPVHRTSTRNENSSGQWKKGDSIGKGTPLASVAKKVFYGIDNPPQTGFAGPSHTHLFRWQLSNQLPFTISQVVLHVIVCPPEFLSGDLVVVHGFPPCLGIKSRIVHNLEKDRFQLSKLMEQTLRLPSQ